MLGIGRFLFQHAKQSFRSETSLTFYDECSRQKGLALLFKHFLRHLTLMLWIIAARQTIDFFIIVSQSLVQRQALQRAVVHVDADGLAIVEEQHPPAAPVFLVEGDAEYGILVGLAFECEFAFGHNGAVHRLRCQAVFQIHRLAVFITHTLDGVLHLHSRAMLAYP